MDEFDYYFSLQPRSLPLREQFFAAVWGMTKFNFYLSCLCQFVSILLGFVGPVRLAVSQP
jgi:hypothetical protein